VTSTVNATAELAAFLRARRERLTPADVGLPHRRQTRRTPGLRREEVAELAGVSTDYIVRLEQARGLRPSPDVLDSLAAALRLSPDERAYLFDLAQHRLPDGARGGGAANSLIKLVDDVSPLPAMLVDHRFDLLAWNAEMSALMLDFATVPPRQRNMVWICLMRSELHDFYVDREQSVRSMIADLRAAWAAHPDDRALAELIAELRSASSEFDGYWAQHDVRVNGRGHKRLCHPTIGPLTIEYEVLIPLQDPDQRLIIYRPADEASRAAMTGLIPVI
jgi:transcriptional regulator with XRE-family HTH domain